jgi:hypothetical protein
MDSSIDWPLCRSFGLHCRQSVFLLKGCEHTIADVPRGLQVYNLLVNCWTEQCWFAVRQFLVGSLFRLTMYPTDNVLIDWYGRQAYWWIVGCAGARHRWSHWSAWSPRTPRWRLYWLIGTADRPIDGLLVVQGLGTDDRHDLLEAHVPHGGAHIDWLVWQTGLLMDCWLCRGLAQMIALIYLKPTYTGRR